MPTVHTLIQKAACCPSGSHGPGCVSQPCCLLAGWAGVGVRDGLQWVIPLSGPPRLHCGAQGESAFFSLPTATFQTYLLRFCRAYLPATPTSPPQCYPPNSLDTPPHSLKPVSSLLSPCLSPASFGGDFKIQVGGPLNRPASGPWASCSPGRSPLAPFRHSHPWPAPSRPVSTSPLSPSGPGQSTGSAGQIT